MSWILIILVGCVLFPNLSPILIGAYVFLYLSDMVVDCIENMNFTFKSQSVGKENELKLKIDQLSEKIKFLDEKIVSLETNEIKDKEKCVNAISEE